MLYYALFLEDQEDEAAFSAAYAAYVDRAGWLASGFFSGNQTLAEEAVQEAFIALAVNFKKYLSLPCQERVPYFVTIVKNKCQDILRREKKYTGMEDAPIPAPAAQDGEETGEAAARAAALIRALPEKYRSVLECRALLEMNNQETARLLGISEDLAAARFRRGRLKVAEQLTKEGLGCG